MLNRLTTSVLFATVGLAACTPLSPYVGQEIRAIKALSPAEIQGLREGQGMGFARAAELNGYPGPMHVLELAEPLALNAAQRAATQMLLQRHKAEARELGAKLIAAEQVLDRAFARQEIGRQRLSEMTAEIGRLQAAVRASHLTTHITQTEMLTREQVERYSELRGYRRLQP